MSKQRKPGRKPTNEQLQSIVETVYHMLLDGKRDHEVKRVLKAAHNLSGRSCARYLSRARSRLVKETQRSRDEHRGESLATYRQILDNPATEPRDRIRAQERIDRLLGLEVHMPTTKRVELSGPDGKPIEQRQTVLVAGIDLTARLEQARDRVREIALRQFHERVAALPAPTPTPTEES